MIHLLMDDFFGPERLAELKRGFSPPDLLDLNTTELDGQRISLRELIEACNAVPFLSDVRLVIVRRLATRFESKQQDGEGEVSGRDATRRSEAQLFCAYLSSVPASTELVLVEPKPLRQGNPFIKAVSAAGGEVVGPRNLKDAELRQWIQDRVRVHGGRISSDAAAQMAVFASGNLRALDNDLDKLVTYAGGEVIAESDVALLVSAAREANVFAMVDAVGQRNSRAALRLLHELLAEGEPPLRLLAMIIRQFRLLLQVSEMQQQGRARQEIASEAQINPYVLPKMLSQVTRFSLRQLEAIYRQLIEADLAVKTGRLDPITSLDLLVVELTRKR